MGCAWARCHPMSPCQPRPHLTFPISPWSDTTGQAQLCQPRGQSTLNLQEHLEADGRPAAGPTLGLLGQLLTPQSSMVTSGAPLGLGISCLVSAVYSGYCLGNCHPPLSLLPLFTAPTLPPGRSQPSCSGRRVGALVRPASHTPPCLPAEPGPSHRPVLPCWSRAHWLRLSGGRGPWEVNLSCQSTQGIIPCCTESCHLCHPRGTKTSPFPNSPSSRDLTLDNRLYL